MIILDIPQGSIEWITQRLWRLTASELKKNITATGKLSKSEASIKAIDKLIAGIELANVINSNAAILDGMDEWQLKKFMSHYTGDSFAGNLHTERGKDNEPGIIAALSEKIGSQIKDVGMCIMGDNINGLVSCSPDGLEYAGGRLVAGAEVKSPCLCNWYDHVVGGVMPDDYKLQVHAGMAICEIDVWHFGSYFKGKPLFYHKVTRDGFTDTLQESLAEFVELYTDRYHAVTSGIELMNAPVLSPGGAEVSKANVEGAKR